MAITQAVCTSFKQEILVEGHNFTNGQDTFKIALYTSSASLDASTTAFSTSNEVSDSGTYSSGGGSLTSVTQQLQVQLQFVILLIYLLHQLPSLQEEL